MPENAGFWFEFLDIDTMPHLSIRASDFDILANEPLKTGDKLAFFGSNDRLDEHPYHTDVSVEMFRRYLPVRRNCSLNWLVHETEGPFRDRSTFTEVEHGIPVNISSPSNVESALVELSVRFEDAIASRCGRSDGLEILAGAEITGELDDIMCMGGLVNTEEWLKATFLPTEIADTILSFSALCRASDRTGLKEANEMLNRKF